MSQHTLPAKCDEFDFELSYKTPKDAAIRPGVLYIGRISHEIKFYCPCGCGTIITLPTSGKTNRSVMIDGNEATVTIEPSFRHDDLPCKSHYFIRDNKVLWVQ